MVKIRCDNPKCKHEWDYKGEGKFYATCPVCYRKLRLVKVIEGEDVKQ